MILILKKSTVTALMSDSCPVKVCLHSPSLTSHSWKKRERVKNRTACCCGIWTTTRLPDFFYINGLTPTHHQQKINTTKIATVMEPQLGDSALITTQRSVVTVGGRGRVWEGFGPGTSRIRLKRRLNFSIIFWYLNIMQFFKYHFLKGKNILVFQYLPVRYRYLLITGTGPYEFLFYFFLPFLSTTF